jgi:hypothetical protein
MQAIRGNARAVETASKFAREQDVAQLRSAIGFQGCEALGRLKIVEIQSRALMRIGSRVDDARGFGG